MGKSDSEGGRAGIEMTESHGNVFTNVKINSSGPGIKQIKSSGNLFDRVTINTQKKK